MGMYDSIDLKMDCPQCGAKYLDFQTKDAGNCLDMLQPEEVENFYTSCEDCGSWIRFNRLDQDLVHHFLVRGKDLHEYWHFGEYYYRCQISYNVSPEGG